MKKFIRLKLLLLIILSLHACNGESLNPEGSSTVVGNPEYRKIEGKLTSNLEDLSINLSSLKRQTTGLNNKSSCFSSSISDSSTIKITAITDNNETVSTTADEAGFFELNLRTDKIYSFQFESQYSSEKCGRLFSNVDQQDSGETLILGKDNRDVNFGSILDLGNNVLLAENNPTSTIDSDNDSNFDPFDLDLNGDGLPDDDCDLDGIPDFIDPNTDSCLEPLGTCDFIQVYPEDNGVLFLNPYDFGSIRLKSNNTFTGKNILTENITIIDLDGNIIINGFSSSSFDNDNSYTELNLNFNNHELESYEFYQLHIPANTLTCEDGNSNPRDLTTTFFVFQEEEQPSTNMTSLENGSSYLFSNSLAAGDFFGIIEGIPHYADPYILENLKAGETIELLLQSNDFDTFLYLFTTTAGQDSLNTSSSPDFSDGVNIAVDDDSATNFNSYIKVTIPADGNYFLMVTSRYPGETGNYTLEAISSSISLYEFLFTSF